MYRKKHSRRKVQYCPVWGLCWGPWNASSMGKGRLMYIGLFDTIPQVTDALSFFFCFIFSFCFCVLFWMVSITLSSSLTFSSALSNMLLIRNYKRQKTLEWHLSYNTYIKETVNLGKRKRKRKTFWNNNWILDKFGQIHKHRNSWSSVKPKQVKCKEIHVRRHKLLKANNRQKMWKATAENWNIHVYRETMSNDGRFLIRIQIAASQRQWVLLKYRKKRNINPELYTQ